MADSNPRAQDVQAAQDLLGDLLADQHRQSEANRTVLVRLQGLVAWLGQIIDSGFAQREELKSLLLANTLRRLTVREAQLCRVCRLCRRPVEAEDVFVLNFGQEFAHEVCLDKEAS